MKSLIWYIGHQGNMTEERYAVLGLCHGLASSTAWPELKLSLTECSLKFACTLSSEGRNSRKDYSKSKSDHKIDAQ